MVIASIDERQLETRIAAALDRWPAGGLAVGIIRRDSLEWFHGHGCADVASRAPVTPDTVFRIASISKTITAIAVMQLWEQGAVELDAPAAEYLRAFRLVPAKAEYRPPTLRDLLTHTAGLGAVRSFADLLRPTLGWGVRVGHPVPSLAEYYRGGLRIEVAPGTKWVYGNHGFAALGQIVEDVSGEPFDRYLREHVFEPLGMGSTDLVRSERVSSPLATGYRLRAHGLRPVADRETTTPGAASVSSTMRDMARYVGALLNGGANEHGTVLEPDTLATMFEPHFQPDPRAPGMGLGFFLGAEGGHRTAFHEGILPGFLSQMVTAPDDGIGVVVFANTGGLDGRGAPVPLGVALLRHLLGLPDEATRPDVPTHAETWSGLCGWYSPDPGPLTNVFVRAMTGAGVEIGVHDGRLTLRGLTPVPGLRKGVPLQPNDPDDPYVFRADFSDLGVGSMPVVFTADSEVGATALHLGLLSLRKRPDVRNPKPWLGGALALGATAFAVRRAAQKR